MGEARRNDMSARDVAFTKSSKCIFCGGIKAAETVDHVPPKAVFDGSIWPEGMVFPACAECNSGTKQIDAVIVVLSSMDPRFSQSAGAKGDKWQRRIKAAMRDNPGLFEEMMDLSSLDKKRMAERMKVERGAGQTYLDLPFMKITPRMNAIVRAFAMKLTKALHFEQTRNIVPADAYLNLSWFTNASDMAGEIQHSVPPEYFTNPETRRGKHDLSDQFRYQWLGTPDGASAVYRCSFRYAFGFQSIVAFPPSELARAIGAGELPIGNKVD